MRKVVAGLFISLDGVARPTAEPYGATRWRMK